MAFLNIQDYFNTQQENGIFVSWDCINAEEAIQQFQETKIPFPAVYYLHNS